MPRVISGPLCKKKRISVYLNGYFSGQKKYDIRLNIIRLVIELVIVLALQISIAGLISIGGYIPDFVLLYIIFRSYLLSSYQLIGGSFLLGLTEDLLGGGFIGLNALSKTATAFLIVKTLALKKLDNTILNYGGVALCIFAHDLVYNYIYGQSEYFGFFPFLFRRVVPVFLYNFILYVVISLIPKKSGKRR